jgi:hypothetical protein
MDMLREWTQCDCQKLWSTGNLKGGKNEVVPEELGKMGYIQQWVKGGRYTAVSGRWDIYISEWKVGYIQQWVKGGRYTSVSGRWDIYSGEWKRSQNGRKEQSKAMEYHMAVWRRRQTFKTAQYIFSPQQLSASKALYSVELFLTTHKSRDVGRVAQSV